MAPRPPGVVDFLSTPNQLMQKSGNLRTSKKNLNQSLTFDFSKFNFSALAISLVFLTRNRNKSTHQEEKLNGRKSNANGPN